MRAPSRLTVSAVVRLPASQPNTYHAPDDGAAMAFVLLATVPLKAWVAQ